MAEGRFEVVAEVEFAVVVVVDSPSPSPLNSACKALEGHDHWCRYPEAVALVEVG